MLIILIPAYLHFVIGHTCGLDSFCPKDFRNSFNLVSYTDTIEYKEEMASLIMENLKCRTSWPKIVLPTFVSILLLLNFCIMAKELSRILPRFQTTAPSAAEDVELSTISAIVEHAEASE